MKYLFFTLVMLMGCGREVVVQNNQSDLDKIKSKMEYLEGVQTDLTNLVNSEFSTCDSNNGETVDVLIRKICNVAKAATEESKVELKSQLSLFNNLLKSQIASVNNDVASNTVSLSSIDTQITSINATLLLIQTDVSNLQTAVASLQNSVNSINGVINSNLVSISIGEENLAAGPIYETLLKRVDNARVNGYVEVLDTPVAVTSNGCNVTNGVNVITITTSANHSLVVGNYVRVYGLDSGRGMTSLDVNSDITVASVPTSTTFTFVAGRNATSNGTFGGSNGSVRRIVGRGLGTLWKMGDASDTSVRTTTLGSKQYNFIIRQKNISTQAEVCYDKTNNNASFSTINTAPIGGSGNIVCK